MRLGGMIMNINFKRNMQEDGLRLQRRPFMSRLIERLFV